MRASRSGTLANSSSRAVGSPKVLSLHSKRARSRACRSETGRLGASACRYRESESLELISCSSDLDLHFALYPARSFRVQILLSERAPSRLEESPGPFDCRRRSFSVVCAGHSTIFPIRGLSVGSRAKSPPPREKRVSKWQSRVRPDAEQPDQQAN